MKDIKTFFRIIYQVYYILNTKQRWKIVGMFFVIFLGCILELIGVSAMLPLIQSIMAPETLMKISYIRTICDALRIQNESSVVWLVGFGIILIYVFKNVYLAFSAYLQASYCSRTLKELSVFMMRAYMKRPYYYFVEHGTGEISRGVNVDVNGVYQVIQNGFRLMTELLLLLLIAGFLIVTDIFMAVGVLICGFACLIFVVVGFKKKISSMSSLYRDSYVDMYKSTAQITGGIKDIYVYCRHNFFLKSFENAYEKVRIASTYNTFISLLPERIIETICVSGTMVVLLLRLGIGADAETIVPKLAVFAMGAFRLLPSISRLTGYVNAFVYNREWVESAYVNIDAVNMLNKKDSESSGDEGTNKCEHSVFTDKVEISDISWRYPDARDNVLDHLSITVKKGEAIGIIGESGAGKSTFGNILLRLYTPNNGVILMDGISIESIPHIWSRTIGYVPQGVFLIDDSIRANVVFGADEGDEERVWRALKKAALDSFVRSLPEGIDTVVGERGVRFSGGQVQRIAIARALYAEPQILVLDEATSALDNETEEAVMEAIDELTGTITMIIIAHRVTTLRNCDKIFEIVNGIAVERDKASVLNSGINNVEG